MGPRERYPNLKITVMIRVKNFQCEEGALYIFSEDDLRTDSKRMWGEVKSHADGRIVLSIASEDMVTFRNDVVLSDEYRFVREASRADIRDFYFNYGYEHLRESAGEKAVAEKTEAIG